MYNSRYASHKRHFKDHSLRLVQKPIKLQASRAGDEMTPGKKEREWCQQRSSERKGKQDLQYGCEES